MPISHASPQRSTPDLARSMATRLGLPAAAALMLAASSPAIAHACGLIVVIVHEPHDYRTVYCHFATIGVRTGDDVARGQPIGTVGTTGQRAWPGYERVHLELQRGRDVAAVEDPRPRLAGCFDAQARYPADRLVLTYPLRCRA